MILSALFFLPLFATAADLTVPGGTVIAVELVDPVSSALNKPGDTFRARLNEGVWVQGRAALPPGITVRGVVSEAVPSGRIKGKAKLSITLGSVELDGKSYQVDSDTLTYAGETHAGKHFGSSFFGALQGALYGVLFGGKEGAVLGAGAGAAASTAASIWKGKNDIKFEQGAKLMFEVLAPITVPAPPPGTAEPPKPAEHTPSAPIKVPEKPAEKPADKPADKTGKPSS